MVGTIRAKVALAMSVMAVLVLSLGILGVFNATQLNEASLSNTRSEQFLATLSSVRQNLLMVETGERGYIISAKERYKAPYIEGKANLIELFKKANELAASQPEVLNDLKQVEAYYAKWLSNSIEKAITIPDQIANGSLPQSEYVPEFMRVTGKPVMDKMTAIMERLEKNEHDLLEKRLAHMAQLHQNITGISVLAMAVALVISLGIAISMSRLLNKKFEYARAHVEAMAKGVFNKEIAVKGRDEIDSLLIQLKKTQDSLKNLISGITQSSDHLSQDAGQVEIASNELSRTSREQSDATENMAATMEELSVSITHISENANDASNTATQAKNSAEDCSKTLQRIVSQIKQISDSVGNSASSVNLLREQSDSISMVISTIQEIAEKTNLLALNAAIEAARAGETGRGFAVVADEVRKLAEQTKGSTIEISEMIERIQQNTHKTVGEMDVSVSLVREGLEQTTEVNQIIQLIKANSEMVSEKISSIDLSIREQSEAGQVLTRSVERISQMTEENNHAATQNADVAKRLRELADELQQAVGVFKVA